jgi:hydroxymethylpyrimidine pyrophosphatase-like HAD family hydrolase
MVSIPAKTWLLGKPPQMIFVFDIDNTLTPPRAAMQPAFAAQFLSFCRSETVYLVTGSDRGKVDEQVPANIVAACAGLFTSAGSEFEAAGRIVYSHDHEFPDEIIEFLDRKAQASKYPVRRGRHIEYRTGALNFSTVGRAADAKDRKAYLLWDQVHGERARLCNEIAVQFPDYEASAGGEISIDISPVGWNKSRVIVPIMNVTEMPRSHFVGDGIHPCGNDWPLAQALQAKLQHHVIDPVQDCAQTLKCCTSLKSSAAALVCLKLRLSARLRLERFVERPGGSSIARQQGLHISSQRKPVSRRHCQIGIARFAVASPPCQRMASSILAARPSCR